MVLNACLRDYGRDENTKQALNTFKKTNKPINPMPSPILGFVEAENGLDIGFIAFLMSSRRLCFFVPRIGLLGLQEAENGLGIGFIVVFAFSGRWVQKGYKSTQISSLKNF